MKKIKRKPTATKPLHGLLCRDKRNCGCNDYSMYKREGTNAV